MPWQNYSSILDEGDAMAIAAYLKSLPPITHIESRPHPPDHKPTGTNMVFAPPAYDVPPPATPPAASK